MISLCHESASLRTIFQYSWICSHLQSYYTKTSKYFVWFFHCFDPHTIFKFGLFCELPNLSRISCCFWMSVSWYVLLKHYDIKAINLFTVIIIHQMNLNRCTWLQRNSKLKLYINPLYFFCISALRVLCHMYMYHRSADVLSIQLAAKPWEQRKEKTTSQGCNSQSGESNSLEEKQASIKLIPAKRPVLWCCDFLAPSPAVFMEFHRSMHDTPRWRGV